MFKLIALWLFLMACLADIVLIALKCFGWFPLGWDIIILIPFAVAVSGTLAFGFFYLLVKLFVTLVLGS